jgi:putative phage-type endonuclease
MTEIVQGSPEWIAIRLGKATASRMADVVAKTKTGWGASRANYAAQLIAERLTGELAESYTNAAMQWGVATEADARMAYEFRTDAEVEQVGFVAHPTIPMSGGSPDGLVSTDGMVELKCPLTATHIETLLGGSVPSKYVCQMQWLMACTGRAWCDFCSFDPRLPEAMRLFVYRVPRDNAMIADLEAQVRVFLAEIEQKVAALTARYLRKEAA